MKTVKCSFIKDVYYPGVMWQGYIHQYKCQHMKFHTRNQGVLHFQTWFLIQPTLTETSMCRKMKVQKLMNCKVLLPTKQYKWISNEE